MQANGGNCLNVSKLLVNNTKNLSSDYNLCRALLRATAGATEIVGTWGFLVDCTEVRRAPLIHFQKMFFKKGLL